MPAILALDQGTTSSRAIVFDESGTALAVAQREFPQIFPEPGRVEHDPDAIWSSQIGTAREALQLAGMAAGDIAAIGIANQRETTLLWDRSTGRPVTNAIVWQDRRTSEFCDALKAAGHSALVAERTGLVIDSYFSASKLRWMLDRVPGARERAEAGGLAFGTVDSWLVWNLTGGARHLTDVTNASRTMLYNIRTGEWDDDLLSLLHIPREVLPEVRSSAEGYGETAPGVFDAPIPIAGIAGDQQAALFGQNCFAPGMAKNTYGTGCFLLVNTGTEPRPSKHRLIATVAWETAGVREFALEGSVFIGGAVVQWLRDGLGMVRSSGEIEALAAGVPDSGGVCFVPAFAGLGAPHWDQYARGAIVGITRGTTAGHIARAALEGIAFQVADVLEAMRQDAGFPIRELRVDGGACANNLLMQFQADILQVPVVRPKVIETTALGAAWLAGLGAGIWTDRSEIQAVWQVDRTFEPAMPPDEAARRRDRWADALRRSADWDRTTPTR